LQSNSCKGISPDLGSIIRLSFGLQQIEHTNAFHCFAHNIMKFAE
jgi:hypothetical protein